MARTCGIRLGRTDFDLLILDGSAKKPNVVACVTGEIPEDSEDPVADLVAALKTATKGLKVPTDAIRVVGESGLAAFRNLVLPFDDAAKIEQVIRFEVESDVPQWDIDDTVVDFHVASSTGVESHLINTIAPKAALAELLEIATKAGLEPQEFELDTTALVNSAHRAGLLTVEGAQLLIHVNRSSTALVVVDGGRVRTMRSVHIGAEHRNDPAALSRFAREVNRTAAGIQATTPLDGIYISGLDFLGIKGTNVADHVVKPLEAFEADNLPGSAHPARFVAAFGAALAELGSVKIKASLRRDNLRFAGKLERLELPLAVFALLLAALAGIYFVVLQRQMEPLHSDMRKWLETSNKFMLGEPAKGTEGYITRPTELLTKRVASTTSNAIDGETTDYDAMLQIRNYLQADIKALEKRIGKDTDIRKPQSVFGAQTRVLKVLDDLGPEQVGYFSILHMIGDFRPARGQTKDYVELKLTMSFFSEVDSLQATANFDRFRNEVMSRPWLVKDGFPEPKTQTLDGGIGIYIESFSISVDMSVLAEGSES